MRPWIRRLLRFLLWSYLGYLAISLLVVLPALNLAAPWAVQKFAQRELRHELLIFNPFKLSVELRKASLHEVDGHVPLALKRAEVNLSAASLWQPGVVLDALRIESIDLHVLRYADGNFHFQDLLSPARDDSEESSGALPGVTVDEVFIGAHTLRFTDRTRQGPYSAAYRDFDVQTRGLTTLPDREGNGELTLIGADGGIVRWRGELRLAESQSVGELSVDGLDLTHLYRYEAENLDFIARSALLDLGLRYRVDWSSQLDFGVMDGRLRLHDVDIAPVDPQALPDTGIQLTALTVDGITVAGSEQRVAVTRVGVEGLGIQGFDRDMQPSPLALFADPAADGVAGAEVPEDDPTATAAGSDESGWQVELAEFALNDSALSWRSELLQPELLQVSPLSVQGSDLHWPPQRPSEFALALGLNAESRLSVSGSLHLGTGSGGLKYQLTTLPLAWFNPVLNQFLRADLQRGALSVDGDLTLDEFAPSRAGSNIGLADLAMQIHGAEDSALQLKSLDVTGLEVALPEQSLSIADIDLQGPRAGLHILEDGSLNISRALVSAQTEAVDEAPATADSDAAEAETADAESPAAWAVRVDHLGVRDGRLDFADDSLPLPFKTLIGDIEADLRDLDSTSEEPLVATLNGAVDGYAPVVIEAQGRPLTKRDGELSFSFRGMDIATMSPYSGTYAGYAIDSGSLSVNLSYRFDGPSMAGENRIIISQMELGEPVESDRAMQLPLQLGIALLTDSEGVIDLDVPISGQLDDPQFSLGRVIARAIGNVIVKAATAPFRFLASLVDSDEDLENIDFAPGSEAVSAQALEALQTLATALEQRPKLQLRVLGGVDPVVDRRALRRQALDRSLLEAGLAEASLVAEDEAFAAAVAERYSALGLPAPEDGEDVPLPAQLDALLASITLPQSALRDLGTRRATAAKRALVNDAGVDAGRVAVSFDSGLLSAGVKMSLSG